MTPVNIKLTLLNKEFNLIEYNAFEKSVRAYFFIKEQMKLESYGKVKEVIVNYLYYHKYFQDKKIDCYAFGLIPNS